MRFGHMQDKTRGEEREKTKKNCHKKEQLHWSWGGHRWGLDGEVIHKIQNLLSKQIKFRIDPNEKIFAINEYLS